MLRPNVTYMAASHSGPINLAKFNLCRRLTTGVQKSAARLESVIKTLPNHLHTRKKVFRTTIDGMKSDATAWLLHKQPAYTLIGAKTSWVRPTP